ncbi:MAG: hypothetical protein Kow00105_18430 [Phycisphaeraceae bacterium]
MTWHTLMKGKAAIYVSVLTLITVTGCEAPRSVVPLLEITERALLEEAERLHEDAARDRMYSRQALSQLEEGYRQDLEQTQALTTEWVLEATRVYTTAREAVLKHQASLEAERRARAENLQVAASATRRALLLLQEQCGLLHGVVGEELDALIRGIDPIYKDAKP